MGAFHKVREEKKELPRGENRSLALLLWQSLGLKLRVLQKCAIHGCEQGNVWSSPHCTKHAGQMVSAHCGARQHGLN